MPDYSAAPQLDSREQHFLIPGPNQGMSLFLRYLPTADTKSRPRRAVLYVHGATFPSALSIAYRFDGRSWRDALGDAGFDVWGVGFLRIRSFRPLSGNGSARDRQLAAMRGGGCREAPKPICCRPILVSISRAAPSSSMMCSPVSTIRENWPCSWDRRIRKRLTRGRPGRSTVSRRFGTARSASYATTADLTGERRRSSIRTSKGARRNIPPRRIRP